MIFLICVSIFCIKKVLCCIHGEFPRKYEFDCDGIGCDGLRVVFALSLPKKKSISFTFTIHQGNEPTRFSRILFFWFISCLISRRFSFVSVNVLYILFEEARKRNFFQTAFGRYLPHENFFYRILKISKYTDSIQLEQKEK